MKLFNAATAALLLGGASTLLPVPPAEAQVLDSLRNRQRAQQPARNQPRIGTLSREESAAVMALYQAVQAQNWDAARAALPAARAGVSSPDGRFLVAQLAFNLAQAAQDRAAMQQAVDEALATTGGTPEARAEVEQIRTNLTTQVAVASGDFGAMETQIQQRLTANPNDRALMEQLADVKLRLNKRDEALALYRRVIQLSSEAGQKASERVYRAALDIAYQARNRQLAVELSRDLVTAYPSPETWHIALAVYQRLNNLQGQPALDIYRLMLATQSMTDEAEYLDYSIAANAASTYGEEKAALEQGISRNVVRSSDALRQVRARLAELTSLTARDRQDLTGQRARVLAAPEARLTMRYGDAYYGYGQYADAVALYRAALAKTGADTGLINLRLGAALAMAGQRAEAEAAFRAVTGQHAELANYWLLWLAARG